VYHYLGEECLTMAIVKKNLMKINLNNCDYLK